MIFKNSSCVALIHGGIYIYIYISSEILICPYKPPLIEGISRENKTLKIFPGQLGEKRLQSGRLTHRIKLYAGSSFLRSLFRGHHSSGLPL